jgi:CxxC motif-containing protein
MVIKKSNLRTFYLFKTYISMVGIINLIHITSTSIYMAKKSTIMALAAVIFTASVLGFNGVARAEGQKASTTWKLSQGHIKNYLKHAPGVIGTVVSINGSSLTISGKNNTTYTIDTTGAKIFKNRNTVITTADIKIGDVIMAQGTVNGTNVSATTVFDGKPIVGKKNQGNFSGVMGIVNGISGMTLSLTAKDGIVYTVNATQETLVERGTPPIHSQISDIKIGDTVMVRGTVNGTVVTAEKIFDGTFAKGNNGNGRNKKQ